MTRLRIGIDALSLGPTPGGVGRYIVELLHEFDEILATRRDFEITAYATEGSAFGDWRPANVHLEIVAPAERSSRRILRQQLWLPRRMRGRHDLIHVPDYLSPAWRVAPLVLTIHDMAYAADPTFFTPGQRMVRALMNPVGIRGARRISADSQFTRDEIERLFPGSAHKTRVVQLGVRTPERVPSEAREALVRRLSLPEEFVLSVCTREPRKNLARLIEAFAIEPRLRGRTLVLAGGAGWGEDTDVVLRRHPEMLRRVIVTGYLSNRDLDALYEMAALFAYVSLYEGFGLPPLEALARGLPVVVSDLAVLREVVGDDAVLVDPRNSMAIGRAIASLLDDRVARSSLAERGPRRAAKFTWRACAEATLALYMDAVESQPR